MYKLSPIAPLVMLAIALGLIPLAANAAHVYAHHAVHAKAKATGKATVRSAKVAAAGRHARLSSTKQAAASAPSAHRTRASAHARVHVSTRGQHVRRALTRRQLRLAKQRSWPTDVQQVHLAMPPPMRGSHESLVHQNVMAEADGLERILDDADLEDRIAHGSLVPVPVSNTLRINTDLPENRRYCRPWTAKFLSDMAKAHASKFGGGVLEVTSAVRTVEYQRRLRTFNGNAAAADGDIASPHLTGGTVDIAKQGLTSRQIGWIRAWLIPLEQAGKIDVEEEFKQSCFHISVYKSYTDPKAPGKPVPLASGSMLAARGR